MGLIFRSSSLANTGATSIKNAPLTFLEGDGNFAWLATNLSGSVVEISGSVTLSGSFSIPTLTTTAQSNVVTVDTATGRLYYTSSTTVGAGSVSTGSLLATASIATNVITFTKGDNSTFALTVNTGSFVVTGSVSSNTLTFTKGDNTTFSLLVATGSGASISTGSFLITGSVLNNTITFTKGDNTTFALIVNTGSIANTAVSSSGSSIYSTNPSTSEFNTTNSIFLGDDAGYQATNAYSSIFLGSGSGYQATNSDNAHFIGEGAGYQATQADNANFIGFLAGYQATNANTSNFIGLYAGQNAGSASYSTFLGFNAGRNYASTGVKSNNIIIGTNISFEDDRKDSINLGGIIFATGSYNTTSGFPFSGSMTTAKVGINKSIPQYTLDVSGSVGIASLLNITESNPLPAGSIGSMAVSASNLWFYSGSAWRQVQLI